MNALDMIREDASEQRGDPTLTVDAKALAKLLALAESILAVNAHVDNQPDTTVADEVMGKWADDLCKLEAAVEEALTALTEPMP
jgi:hypothetical protein